MKKLGFIFAALALVLMFAGCDNGDTPDTIMYPPTGITITSRGKTIPADGTATIGVEQVTFMASATADPAGGAVTYTWTITGGEAFAAFAGSINTGATVTINGLAIGTASIEVTATNSHGSFTVSFDVVVANLPTAIAVTAGSENVTENGLISIFQDSQCVLNASATADSAGGAVTYAWTIESGGSFVEFDGAVNAASAAIKGLEEGTAAIKVTASNDAGSLSFDFYVKVVGNQPTAIAITTGSFTVGDYGISIGVDETQELTALAEANPAAGTITYAWTIESGGTFVEFDGAVNTAKVTIKGLAEGFATIKVIAENDVGPLSKTFVVEVTELLLFKWDNASKPMVAMTQTAQSQGSGFSNAGGEVPFRAQSGEIGVTADGAFDLGTDTKRLVIGGTSGTGTSETTHSPGVFDLSEGDFRLTIDYRSPVASPGGNPYLLRAQINNNSIGGANSVLGANSAIRQYSTLAHLTNGRGEMNGETGYVPSVNDRAEPNRISLTFTPEVMYATIATSNINYYNSLKTAMIVLICEGTTSSITITGLRLEKLANNSTLYDVNIDGTITGGTIAVDKPTARAGAVVTVTGTPGSEMELSSILVDGVSHAIDSNKTVFIMPAKDVVVTATFVPVSYETLFEWDNESPFIAGVSSIRVNSEVTNVYDDKSIIVRGTSGIPIEDGAFRMGNNERLIIGSSNTDATTNNSHKNGQFDLSNGAFKLTVEYDGATVSTAGSGYYLGVFINNNDITAANSVLGTNSLLGHYNSEANLRDGTNGGPASGNVGVDNTEKAPNKIIIKFTPSIVYASVTNTYTPLGGDTPVSGKISLETAFIVLNSQRPGLTITAIKLEDDEDVLFEWDNLNNPMVPTDRVLPPGIAVPNFYEDKSIIVRGTTGIPIVDDAFRMGNQELLIMGTNTIVPSSNDPDANGAHRNGQFDLSKGTFKLTIEYNGDTIDTGGSGYFLGVFLNNNDRTAANSVLGQTSLLGVYTTEATLKAGTNGGPAASLVTTTVGTNKISLRFIPSSMYAGLTNTYKPYVPTADSDPVPAQDSLKTAFIVLNCQRPALTITGIKLEKLIE